MPFLAAPGNDEEMTASGLETRPTDGSYGAGRETRGKAGTGTIGVNISREEGPNTSLPLSAGEVSGPHPWREAPKLAVRVSHGLWLRPRS